MNNSIWLIIWSNWILYEFNFVYQIMDIFGVVTLDQRLSLDGVQLEGNDKTLTDLKIVPNSTIILTVS